jgi:hypothetical protein
MTQTWVADDLATDRLTYEAVSCLACSQQHFVCVATGKALGDNVDAVTTVRGPAFPPKQVQRCHDRVASPLDAVGPRPKAIIAAQSTAPHHKLH